MTVVRQQISHPNLQKVISFRDRSNLVFKSTPIMRRLLDAVLFLCCFAGVITLERKMSTTLNPGCGPTCDDTGTVVVYTRAEGLADVVHHLWSTVGGRPTFMVAVTPNPSQLSIDWERFIEDHAPPGSITFEPQLPTTVFAFVIDKLIEFTDVNNTGRMDEMRSDVRISRLDMLEWTLATLDNSSTSFEGRFKPKGTPGLVTIKLNAFGEEGHGDLLPHLYHSSNSSQVDIVLDSVPNSFHGEPHAHTRRLALKLVAAAAPAHSPVRIVARRSLDDEHSPGVFEVTEVLASNRHSDFGGYLQWKNVSYNWAEGRTMTNSTVLQNYAVALASESDVGGTLVGALLGSPVNGSDMTPVTFSAFNVSIGAKDDNYYTKTNYATWTLLVGVGQPVEEQFSTIILAILIVGLGLPTLLIIFGICCIIVRRFTKRTNEIILSQ
ncbi:hypothetical protein AAG570_004266 [Ranatra chinensis]|uniref:Glycosylated lysosomal membrane protein n=1 Tax=Ranatra chinensis TaxID=642074 RepID=A0ABD0Y5K6_9HEMI